MYEAVAPYALALVVADNIHQDPGTGKFTILGTFSTIGAPEFPAVHGSIAVYFAVTDGRGNCDLSVRLVTGDEEHILAEVRGEVMFTDPRLVVEGAWILSGVVFPNAGEYRVQLWCGTEPLLERRIMIRALPQ